MGSIWQHEFTNCGIDIELKPVECNFCKTDLVLHRLDREWPINSGALRTEHEHYISYMHEIHGDMLRHLEITSDFRTYDVRYYCCPACGWWCLVHMVDYDTPGLGFMTYQWAAGSIAKEEFPDLSAPLSEVRDYLCARYEKRLLMNPYQLEEIVASIFHSFGCSVKITNRSHDGGLDIFGLDVCEKPFGVQVKRYREKIGVEQVRSFLGALLIAQQTRGVFVTTSSFTGGAVSLTGKANERGIQLKYVDAERLFEMLKVAQVTDFDFENIAAMARNHSETISELAPGSSTHMGSI